jgi:Na+/H+ antiporter NhaD/arsenite permease-like protein
MIKLTKMTKLPPLIITIFLLSGFYSRVFASSQEGGVLPPPVMALPFVLMILLIAAGPLFFKHFWEKHYPKVSILLAVFIAAFYLFFMGDYVSLIHTAAEYISFIALLSSLFIVSGGILIKIDRKATPVFNVVFLAIGSVIANVIGTTGASMLLIRPYIKINKGRIAPYHIIFFIFLVSNIGGALTPIGDPPLFLGFLKGVPFFWVIENVWFIWIPTVILILAIFYFYDRSNKKGEESKAVHSGKIEISGKINFIYLAVIIVSVFIDPAVIPAVPSLGPLPFGIREVIMFAVSFIAYKRTDIKILRSNEFDFEPIKEVAFLFVGIFVTMIPALQLIAAEAKVLGNRLDAGVFFWASGILSSVLDNAPTYLNFLSAEMGKYNLNLNFKADVLAFVAHDSLYLRAISVGAVFFGAMTYIGNGPNFMVKSISERAGIEMPGFMGYVFRYSALILLPVFVFVWLVFFFNKG